MARAALPPLPLRDGVGPSCVAVPGAGWPTVLDFLAERLPTLTRDEWRHRLDSGQVLDAQGRPVAAELPCRGGLRLFYYRGWADEPALDGAPEQIVFQDDWLVVADKPHFMPVTPGGRFVQRSLLVRLRRRLGIDGLSPIHRIDRETAGLVAFAVQRAERGQAQAAPQPHQQAALHEAPAGRDGHEVRLVGHHQPVVLEDDAFALGRGWLAGPAAVVEQALAGAAGRVGGERLAGFVQHRAGIQARLPFGAREGGQAVGQEVEHRRPARRGHGHAAGAHAVAQGQGGAAGAAHGLFMNRIGPQPASIKRWQLSEK